MNSPEYTYANLQENCWAEAVCNQYGFGHDGLIQRRLPVEFRPHLTFSFLPLSFSVLLPGLCAFSQLIGSLLFPFCRQDLFQKSLGRRYLFIVHHCDFRFEV